MIAWKIVQNAVMKHIVQLVKLAPIFKKLQIKIVKIHVKKIALKIILKKQELIIVLMIVHCNRLFLRISK